MHLKPFIALPILIVLSSCGEKTTVQDRPPEPSGEISASETNEVTGAKAHAPAPDFELQEPAALV